MRWEVPIILDVGHELTPKVHPSFLLVDIVDSMPLGLIGQDRPQDLLNICQDHDGREGHVAVRKIFELQSLAIVTQNKCPRLPGRKAKDQNAVRVNFKMDMKLELFTLSLPFQQILGDERAAVTGW